jgi:ubiquinone/menaquinone biosynthesis C-methylase UbiE
MGTKIEEKLKQEINPENIKNDNGITIYLNNQYIVGDNEKFMKMYDWMSYGYDFAETVFGKIKYGNSIKECRQNIMNRLEWKNDISVLYVSIGTGTDFNYMPVSFDLKTIDFVGADISVGMLKQCKKKYSSKTNLELVNCCGEDLPFKDNQFDIVFHIGGINFFNDKELAIKEMIRVAKPNTKLLIADETADYIDNQYKKSLFSKSYYKGKTFDLSSFENLIPKSVKEYKTELLWKNKFYCITFRK